MEWINGEISRSLELNPNIELYRFNDDVYDEIVLKDGAYTLIRRCGKESFTLNHSHANFITDGKILIYPLEQEIEEELDLRNVSSFSELTEIRIIDGEYVNTSMTLDIDRRYIEYVDIYTGSKVEMAVENYDPNRPSYLYKIVNKTNLQLFDALRLPSITIGGAAVTNNGDGSFTVTGTEMLNGDYNNWHNYSHEDVINLFETGDIWLELNGDEIYPELHLQFMNGNDVVLDVTEHEVINDGLLSNNRITARAGFVGESKHDIIAGTITPKIYQKKYGNVLDGNAEIDGTFEKYLDRKVSPSLDYPSEIKNTDVELLNNIYELPEGYKRVEYLESDGKTNRMQFALPTYTFKERMNAEFEMMKLSEFEDNKLHMYVQAYNGNGLYLFYNGTDIFQHESGYQKTERFPLNTRLKFVACDGKKSITNVDTGEVLDSYTYSGGKTYPYAASGSLYLFGGGADYYAHCRIYHVKFFDGDTVIVDLLPCLDDKGRPCLYDVVNKQTQYAKRHSNSSPDFTYGEQTPIVLDIKPLLSNLSQTIKDTITLDGTVHRNIQSLVLDGTEDWYGDNGNYYLNRDDMRIVNVATGEDPIYDVISDHYFRDTNVGFIGNSLYIKDNQHITLSSFKNFLSSEKPIVHYVANEQDEQLSPEQKEIVYDTVPDIEIVGNSVCEPIMDEEGNPLGGYTFDTGDDYGLSVPIVGFEGVNDSANSNGTLIKNWGNTTLDGAEEYNVEKKYEGEDYQIDVPNGTGKVWNFNQIAKNKLSYPQGGTVSTYEDYMEYTFTSIPTSTMSNTVSLINANDNSIYLFAKGRKFYMSIEVMPSVDMGISYTWVASGYGAIIPNVKSNIWTRMQAIISIPETTTDGMQAWLRVTKYDNVKIGNTLKIKHPMIVDLTQMYGAGNEPTLEEFKAQFPEEYYDSVASKYISSGMTETTIDTIGGKSVVWNQMVGEFGGEKIVEEKISTKVLEDEHIAYANIKSIKGVSREGYNLIRPVFANRLMEQNVIGSEREINGVHFEFMEDGRIHMYGTATNTVTDNFCLFRKPCKIGSTMTLSIKCEGTAFAGGVRLAKFNISTNSSEYANLPPFNIDGYIGHAQLDTDSVVTFECNNDWTGLQIRPLANSSGDCYYSIMIEEGNIEHDFEPYTTKIINADVKNIVAIGKNYWSLGDISYATASKRSIFIPKGNYCFSCNNNTWITFRLFWDESMNIENSKLVQVSNTHNNIVIEKDVYGINWMISNYTEPITHIQIERGDVPTDYIPYNSNSLFINSSTYFTDGMKSVGNVHDEIIWKTNVACIDLGSLNWYKATEGFRVDNFNNHQNPNIAPLVSNFFEALSFVDRTYEKDKVLFISRQDSALVAIDNSYTDAIAFKQAMEGVKLWFEPITGGQDMRLYIQRVGTVDLGTLNWHYEQVSSGDNYYATKTSFNNAKPLSLVFSPLFTNITSASPSYRNNAWISPSGFLNITADGFKKNASTFKAYMSNVFITYEMMYPIISSITEASIIDTNIPVIEGGTISFTNTLAGLNSSVLTTISYKYSQWTEQLNTFHKYFYNNEIITNQDSVNVIGGQSQLFDLTKMYGIGYEPNTDKLNKTLTERYYKYNEGTLLNADVQKIVNNGKNLLNLLDDRITWYQKDAAISKDTNSVGVDPSKDHQISFIKQRLDYWGLQVGHTYTFSYKADGYIDNAHPVIIFEFRKNNNEMLLETDLYIRVAASRKFTIPLGAENFTLIIRADQFQVQKTGVVSFYDLLLQETSTLSDFSPYFSETIDVSPIISKYFPTGMKSAGNVYDYIDFENGIAVNRIDSVDLGSLRWNVLTNVPNLNNTYDLQGKISGKHWSQEMINAITENYLSDTGSHVYTKKADKTIGCDANGLIYLYDSTHEDLTGEQIKTKLSGQIMYYEKSTPTYISIEPEDLEILRTLHTEGGGTLTFQSNLDVNLPVPNKQTQIYTEDAIDAQIINGAEKYDNTNNQSTKAISPLSNDLSEAYVCDKDLYLPMYNSAYDARLAMSKNPTTFYYQLPKTITSKLIPEDLQKMHNMQLEKYGNIVVFEGNSSQYVNYGTQLFNQTLITDSLQGQSSIINNDDYSFTITGEGTRTDLNTWYDLSHEETLSVFRFIGTYHVESQTGSVQPYIEFRNASGSVIHGSTQMGSSITVTDSILKTTDVYARIGLCYQNGTEFNDGDKLDKIIIYYGEEKPVWSPYWQTYTTIPLVKNGVAGEYELPVALEPFSELVYEQDYNRWIYYPDKGDVQYYDADMTWVTDLDTSWETDDWFDLTTIISKIDIRELATPNNITIITDPYTGDNDFGYITWEETLGATEYLLSIDGGAFAKVDNIVDALEQYHFESENGGVLSIKALNDLTESEDSEQYQFLTIPNTPKIKNIDTTYENNRYYIKITFDANSSFADNYIVSYSVDGANPRTANFDHDHIYGSEKVLEFTSAIIASNLTVGLIASNKSGVNNYSKPVMIGTNNGFEIWTYKQEQKSVFLVWRDNIIGEDYYVVKYKIGDREWGTFNVDGLSGSGERITDFTPTLLENEEMKVCLAYHKDGYTNIFTRPITVSKALDKTLIPPVDFNGTITEDHKIQFTWTDDYGVESRYELSYEDSQGNINSVMINRENLSNGKYKYVYNLGAYGFVTAKLRMLWEFGESDFTNNIVIYNIPIVDEAPELHKREKQDNQLIISWEMYDFVKNYTLYFTINGTQYIYDTSDNSFTYDIPSDDFVINISARVQATFIDGSVTNISDSMDFTLCQKSHRVYSTIYGHEEKAHNIYSVFGSRDLVTKNRMYTLNTNKYIDKYFLYQKNYTPFLFTEYLLNQNYWGKGIGSEASVETIISNMISKDYPITEVTFVESKTGHDIETIIYNPYRVEYNVHTEIRKITIACLGDSITAGHPNYWAETGTGDITSQYEYWLDRRLKGEFNVVNKGYGQEKLVDMVERFERDIVPLSPHYMILHGGTNDWYQDASTKDLETGYVVMDRAKGYVMDIVQKCWDNGIYPIISTLLPRRDINENGKILFDYFNDWIKEYATEQTMLGKDCAYIDFFNAGNDFDPPQPIGDPEDPYKLNPDCDGDNVYDENGVLIRSGLGVHPNINGYKIMGYAIPLTLFKTSNTGMKLYRDVACTIEETYNTQEISKPYYQLNVNNVRRGKVKQIKRYIKNVGIVPTLYYIYLTSPYNMKYYFVDSQGNKQETLHGICNANLIKELNLVIESEYDDFESSFELHILTRDISS